MQGTSDKNKNSKQQLQQLAVQQQQLVQQIQQIQLQQRQFLLACLVQPFGVPQGKRLFFLFLCMFLCACYFKEWLFREGVNKFYNAGEKFIKLI